MEGLMRKGSVIWLMMMMMTVMITSVAGREPHLHKVGGSKGWKENVNYTEWALHEIFYVGDWLNFVFDKHIFTVFEVNKANYEACSELNFITNITRGGRDVFNLTEARPYHFISGGGYCFNGVKLAINVTDYVPAPSPSPSKEGTHSKSGSSQIELQSLFVILVAWAFSTYIS